MTLPRPLLIALYLVGRSWSVWIVAVALIFVMRAQGAGGFDAVILAIGPAILWMGFSWVCRMLTRPLGNPFERSILPTNRPLPQPQLAVVVAPSGSDDACPAPPGMVEQLPDSLRALVTLKAD